jgi:hypothetical protein
MPKLRLNLGSGDKYLEGYVNVDKFGKPDVRHDLEKTPWPWKDDSVEEVILSHVLEHLGRETATYERIIKELYRVCCDGARILIQVPHHRHDSYFADPTHVRPITPLGIRMLSQAWNRGTLERGGSDTPLGIYWGVDFETVETRFTPSEIWRERHPEQGEDFDRDLLIGESKIYNNMIKEVTMLLKVVKKGKAAGPDVPRSRARKKAVSSGKPARKKGK